MKARFFASDALEEEIGPVEEQVIEAESFQLTYDLIRTVPDGETIAYYSQLGGVWMMKADHQMFSDVVFYEEVS